MALLITWLATLIQAVLSQNFCSVDKYPYIQESQLRFSKELSEVEYATLGTFKSLHCCSEAFRTVEWFKDDFPYPWPSEISSLILNPASHNQTIYTQAVTTVDSGLYKCLVSNKTHRLQHEVFLTFTSSGFVGPPKVTYSPKSQYRRVGDTARFYCEAYVGNIPLPDAQSEVFWTRHRDNFTEDLGKRHTKRIIHREEKRVLGAFLTINDVQHEDFGDYYCTVSNTGDQFLQIATQLRQIEDENKDWKPEENADIRIILGVSFGFVTFLIIIVTAYRCKLHLRLLWKALRERSETNESDDVDVTLLYHEKDVASALNFILPTVQHKSSYTCYCKQFNSENQPRKSDIIGKRLLIIVTPPATNNTWTAESIANFIHHCLGLHSKVICIFFQELPIIDIKTEGGRNLKNYLSRVHYITHNEVRDKDFWAILKLGMPLHKRSRARHSRESLEQLM